MRTTQIILALSAMLFTFAPGLAWANCTFRRGALLKIDAVSGRVLGKGKASVKLTYKPPPKPSKTHTCTIAGVKSVPWPGESQGGEISSVGACSARRASSTSRWPLRSYISVTSKSIEKAKKICAKVYKMKGPQKRVQWVSDRTTFPAEFKIRYCFKDGAVRSRTEPRRSFHCREGVKKTMTHRVTVPLQVRCRLPVKQSKLRLQPPTKKKLKKKPRRKPKPRPRLPLRKRSGT